MLAGTELENRIPIPSSQLSRRYIYIFIYIIGSGYCSRDRAHVGSGYSVVKVQLRRTSQVVGIGRAENLSTFEKNFSLHVVGI